MICDREVDTELKENACGERALRPPASAEPGLVGEPWYDACEVGGGNGDAAAADAEEADGERRK